MACFKCYNELKRKKKFAFVNFFVNLICAVNERAHVWRPRRTELFSFRGGTRGKRRKNCICHVCTNLNTGCVRECFEVQHYKFIFSLFSNHATLPEGQLFSA